MWTDADADASQVVVTQLSRVGSIAICVADRRPCASPLWTLYGARLSDGRGFARYCNSLAYSTDSSIGRAAEHDTAQRGQLGPREGQRARKGERKPESGFFNGTHPK